MPSLDMCLRHNLVLMWLERKGIYHGVTCPGATFALKQINGRKLQNSQESKDKTREDLLDKFLRVINERPNVVSDQEVLGSSLSMMTAGAETTLVHLPLLISAPESTDISCSARVPSL